MAQLMDLHIRTNEKGLISTIAVSYNDLGISGPSAVTLHLELLVKKARVLIPLKTMSVDEEDGIIAFVIDIDPAVWPINPAKVGDEIALRLAEKVMIGDKLEHMVFNQRPTILTGWRHMLWQFKDWVLGGNLSDDTCTYGSYPTTEEAPQYVAIVRPWMKSNS